MGKESMYELFLNTSIHKRLEAVFPEFTLGNSEIVSDSMKLTESLCSDEELRFGCCEASVVSFRVTDSVQRMKGKKFRLQMYVGSGTEPFVFGTYTVDSDKPTADRRYRDITAYDAMYDIINSNVADWYNELLPDKTSTVTMKQFRTSFAAHFGLEQEDVTLVNDDMTVEKTVEPSELSGKDVITAICEINGCFGHIGRNGKLCYIYLKEMTEGLYPSNTLYPSNALFPSESGGYENISKSRYVSCKYEDFKTKRIDKLQIRQEENDVGCVYGDGENCYIIQGNFLVYGKSADELNTVAENLYPVLRKVCYRPAAVEASGNPCLEVGNGIRLATKREIIYTYILRRTLKGIQALRDTYEADGVEQYSENVNSVAQSILQLKGKTNTLTRTVEETRLEMKDLELGLSNDIRITAEGLAAEILRASGEEGKLSASLSATAEGLSAEIKRSTDKEAELAASIGVTAEQISAEVTRATGAEELLRSSVTQTAESISAEVRRAQGQEVELAAAIAVNAENINLKVSKGNVSSQLSIESGLVELKSDRFALTATNCSISRDGTIKAKNVDLSGKINSETGKIGGFDIGKTALYNLKSSFLDNKDGVYIGTDGISIGKNATYWQPTSETSWKQVTAPRFSVSSDGEVNIFSSCITLGSSGSSEKSSLISSDGIKILSNPSIYNGSEGRNIITYNKIEIRDYSYSLGTQSVLLNNEGLTIVNQNNLSKKMISFESNGYDGFRIGFFGTTPVKQQSASTLEGVIAALKNYGLLS